jgi:hypothetical protein
MTFSARLTALSQVEALAAPIKQSTLKLYQRFINHQISSGQAR